MIQTFDTNTLREQLLYEINHSTPETLEMFYNIIKVIQKPFSQENNEHHLLKHFGTIDEIRGQEMIDCVNSEFNNIEGEW